ncbi:MAG: transporter associated domain-containing protein [Bacillota bacterium]
MLNDRLKHAIRKGAFYLEYVLALFIVISVIIGMVDLIRYLILIYTTNPYDTYDVFQKFLGHVLLMVVGVELVSMLVFHSPSSVVEVLLYAVARKLLIYNEGMLDFIIGIAAVAAIFAIRKFLFVEKLGNTLDRNPILSAATSIETVNELMHLYIPDHLGNTIGGVLSNLAASSGSKLYEGAEFYVANAYFRIVKMQDGVIEKVTISTNKR